MKTWFFLCNWLLILSNILFVITLYQADLSIQANKRKNSIVIGLIFITFFTVVLVLLNVVAVFFLKDLSYPSLFILLISMAVWFTSPLWTTPDLIAQQKRSLLLLAKILFIGGMLLSFVLFLFVIIFQQH